MARSPVEERPPVGGKPPWLKVKIPRGRTYQGVRETISGLALHTVCQEANCPNLGECWSSGTATFMILGDTCTRDCRFCAVTAGKPDLPDPNEPLRVAEAVREMRLRYAVITSVTRDDLPDGGAGAFAETIRRIREMVPGCRAEVLIPDFGGSRDALERLIEAKPDVLNHNIETVRRLQRTVRPQADYERSLSVLRMAKEMDPAIPTKSGLILGLGESWFETVEAMDDLRGAGAEILTLGQYLRPSKGHLPIEKFYAPEEFEGLKDIALNMGFRHVEAGPLVRSSYHAERQGAI